MSVYIDASVVLPLFVVEKASDVVGSFFEAVDEPVVISEFVASEVSSALSRLVRMGELPAANAALHLADFDAWRLSFADEVEIVLADFRLATLFVRRFEFALRAPDALHLAICRRADLTLVTLDQRLGAATEPLGVAVLTP